MKVWVLLSLRFQLRGNSGMKMRHYVPWNLTKSKTTTRTIRDPRKAIARKGYGNASELKREENVLTWNKALTHEINAGTFASWWQSTYAGLVPKSSLFSFFQRLGMTKWHWVLV